MVWIAFGIGVVIGGAVMIFVIGLLQMGRDS
jgi:hypothetical protein